ncbi:ATP-binding cassette domain-containing protein [Cryobacterium sp. TMT1-3]|uniref:ATP-binding cassette domain-containing protein n=1 Tax=Cryobacterium luteum TaxID=1424661 RepID=A0A1H8A9N0_9MICO|nr:MULTISPECIES: ATP-binding cassette domain-containing protein [Cryobacterium]TFB88412.1 ATP-binding cassette domain-containing protein [Cryobacterium luteum]TFC24439.1 ATP-binding cassette domain-containing protein [Cryobacterium sp. TMT1-3]SEM66257.1 molybdate transport system ATP-binding protein [Cryobacterium luteum]
MTPALWKSAANALLTANLQLTRGSFSLDLRLTLAPGEVLALLGPNGSGKSTVLELLAGLATPSSGSVALDGTVLTAPGRVVAPENRAIGLLGQEPLLFPHLSARANVAFALRVGEARLNAAQARQQADRWLDRVGLTGLGDSVPGALSGGQQQRVALARALAAGPRVLLLDEPMAGLDAETAPLMRQLIREQLAETGTSAIIVTHDIVDAVVLADRVAVLHDGTLIDEGTTAAVLAAPRNPFVAALAGVNLVVGTVQNGAIVAPDGRTFAVRPADAAALASAGPAAEAIASDDPEAAGIAEALEALDDPAESPRIPLAPGSGNASAAAVFRPASVVVQTEQPRHASPRNVWSARVTGIEPGSSGVRLRTSGDPEIIAELTPAAVADLGLQLGSTVWLSVKATEVSAYHR